MGVPIFIPGGMIVQLSLKRILLASLVFISIFIPHRTPPHAASRDILQQKEVTVLFDQSLKAAAEEAAALYPMVREEIEKVLGWKVRFGVQILLMKDSAAFQKIAGSDLIVAFAASRENLIVIDYSRMRTDPFRLEATLKHELCHLLLHHYIKEKDLPRWADEGISQWIGGGISEILGGEGRSLLEPAILAGKYIPIRALTRRFPEDRTSLLLAYEESESLITYIIDEHGLEALRRILGRLRDGETLDAAILATLFLSFDALERAWYDHLRKRVTWLTYLINHIYQILFSLGAILLIYGFIRTVMKKRAYENDDEDGNDFSGKAPF